MIHQHAMPPRCDCPFYCSYGMWNSKETHSSFARLTHSYCVTYSATSFGLLVFCIHEVAGILCMTVCLCFLKM